MNTANNTFNSDLQQTPIDDSQLVQRLCSHFNAGEKMEFVFFWGHQPAKSGITASCFSQWYNAPFVIEGQSYPTAEHFMMAEKASLFDDHDIKERILQAPNPRDAKALGRQIRGFNESVWLEHRFEIVVRANRAKFGQNHELGQFLRQTGDRILVEASPVDSVWGIGLAQDNEKVNDPNQWCGLNLLGFALMKVRSDA